MEFRYGRGRKKVISISETEMKEIRQEVIKGGCFDFIFDDIMWRRPDSEYFDSKYIKGAIIKEVYKGLDPYGRPYGRE